MQRCSQDFYDLRTDLQALPYITVPMFSKALLDMLSGATHLSSMAKKHTSSRNASKAAEILRDPNASKIARSLAGSALRQTDPDAATSPEMAEKAARALDNRNSSKDTRSLAGTVLAQAEPPPRR